MKTTSADQNESTSSSTSLFSSAQNTPTDQFETKYKKHQKLGSGCSSTAYACTLRNNMTFTCVLEEKIEDKPCETKLCVKVTKFTDEAKLPACENEFSLLQSLSHPAIVKCHDFYPDLVNNQCMTVLDRIEGTGLDQLSCDEKTTLVIIRKVCEALRYMHSMNVCHRDLKPDNLIVDGENIVIIDFNVGARMDTEGNVSGGQGLKEWSAPETRRSFVYNGAKADAWSLGLIFGYLLNGKVPTAEITAEERA